MSYLFSLVLENGVSLCCFVVLFLLLWYHWNRRKFYVLSWKCTGPFAMPVFGNLFDVGTDVSKIIHKLNELSKYSGLPRVWIGNKLLVFISNAEDAGAILGNSKCLEKPDYFYGLLKPAVGNGLFTAPVNIWKLHRKIINPMFNQKILDSFVETYNQKVEIMVKLLEKKVGKEFDIFHQMCLCTLDIITDTALGVNIEAQVKECEFLKLSQSVMKQFASNMFNPLVHLDFIFRRTKKGIKFHKDAYLTNVFISKVIQQKKEILNNNRIAETVYDNSLYKSTNLLDHLMQEERFTDLDLVHHVHTFIVGGSDTSGTVMSFICVMLGMHQDIQDKVYQEIEEVLGDSDRYITSEDLMKLQYLERVIKETMRLFPVTQGFGRETTSEIQIGPHTAPPGVVAFIDIFNIHRNPKYYPDPNKFDPDRFLPKEAAKRPPYSYLSFSAGARNCIGFRFGMMSMKVVLATLFRKYKFSTSYKTIEDIRLEWHMIMKAVDGSNVTIELRTPKTTV